jgi:hypothetical protein
MKFNKWTLGLACSAVVCLAPAVSAQSAQPVGPEPVGQTNIVIAGVSIPVIGGLVSAQDIQNAENTAAQVEDATNGMSFTNTSFYAGTGLENADGVGGAQFSYLDFYADLWKLSSFDLGPGAQVIFGDTGSTLQSIDLRFVAFKDLSNFQLYAGPILGRTLSGSNVGFYAGGALGVRYNLSAALADTTNPILKIIAGSTSIHTYAETEFDIAVPFNVSPGNENIEREWKVGVGVSF